MADTRKWEIKVIKVPHHTEPHASGYRCPSRVEIEAKTHGQVTSDVTLRCMSGSPHTGPHKAWLDEDKAIVYWGSPAAVAGYR